VARDADDKTGAADVEAAAAAELATTSAIERSVFSGVPDALHVPTRSLMSRHIMPESVLFSPKGFGGRSRAKSPKLRRGTSVVTSTTATTSVDASSLGLSLSSSATEDGDEDEDEEGEGEGEGASADLP
jgi:hypothetical protein